MGYKDSLKDNSVNLTYKEITELELQKLKEYEKKKKKELEKIKDKKPEIYQDRLRQLKQKVKDKKDKLLNKEKIVLKELVDDTYIKVDKKEKKRLAHALKSNLNSFLKFQNNNYNTIITQISKNINVKTYKNAEKLISQIDISIVFGIKGNIKCPIIKGNVGSVNKDKDGHYRYFSKEKNRKECWTFDLIDLTEIVFDVSYYKAVKMLCDMANIKVKEGGWSDMQKLKYANNIEVIKNADSEMATRFPVLYKYINKHLYLLQELNCIGIGNVGSKQESADGESVFFTSSRYIEEYFLSQDIKKDHTTIDRLINAFTALGLLEKVALSEVPEHFSKTAKEKQQSNGYHYTVNFYSIPEMKTRLLIEAEKRATKLKEAGIGATKINSSDDNIKKVLGLEIFNYVYGDTAEIAKNIVKKRMQNKAVENTPDTKLPF